MAPQGLNELKELATEVYKLREKVRGLMMRLTDLYQVEEDVEDLGAHDSLTDEEEAQLSKIFYSMHKARRALHKTFDTLWEWQYDLNRTRDRAERMAQPDKALKDLEESDNTSK